MKSLLATLEHAFQPVLSSAVGTWGAQLADSGDELFGGVSKYLGMLTDAVHTVEGGIELARPSMRNTEAVELKQPAFARIAQNPEVIDSYEAAVGAWCSTLEDLLNAIEQMPEDYVIKAEKEKEKRRRERKRQEQQALQDKQQEERNRKSIERSMQAPKTRTGRQVMFRSAPVRRAVREEKKEEEEDQDEIKHLS